jgi:hypothetical protein
VTGQNWRKSTEEWKAAQAEKVAAAQAALDEAVASIQSGDDWMRWLEWQSKLHAYSPRNVMLLASQAISRGIDLSYCAGFNTWKALGRRVDKGESGLAVIAPCPGKLRVAVDSDGQERLLRRDEIPEAGEQLVEKRAMKGFKVEWTFDVSQTSGDPIPTHPTPRLLEGEAPPGLGVAVMRLVESRGYEVGTVADSGALNGANGVTRWDSRQVLVRADMDDAAMVKTLIHEAGHVLLHENMLGMPRGRKEVEAESVAFVVAFAHGMPTDDYSFPYVAGWAATSKDPAREVLATQDRVANAARIILDSSPADHMPGGRVPGMEHAVERRKAEREARKVVDVEPATAALGLGVA